MECLRAGEVKTLIKQFCKDSREQRLQANASRTALDANGETPGQARLRPAVQGCGAATFMSLFFDMMSLRNAVASSDLGNTGGVQPSGISTLAATTCDTRRAPTAGR